MKKETQMMSLDFKKRSTKVEDGCSEYQMPTLQTQCTALKVNSEHTCLCLT